MIFDSRKDGGKIPPGSIVGPGFLRRKMKLYNLKQAADLIGINHKQFYKMIADNMFSSSMYLTDNKKLTLQGVSEIARDYFQYKIDVSGSSEKKTAYKAHRVALEMRLFAEDILESPEVTNTGMLFLARKLLANANKTTSFIKTHAS